MIQDEQALYDYSYYLSGNPLSGPEALSRDVMEAQCWSGDRVIAFTGFSEAQMEAVYRSMQADASAFSTDFGPLLTKPLIKQFEAQNNDTSLQISDLPCSSHHASSGSERLDTLPLNYWTPEEESASNGIYMNMECQQSEMELSDVFSQHMANLNYDHSLQLDANGKMVVSGSSPVPFNMSRKCRQSSFVAQRRFIINQKVQAFEGLLPASLQINRESVARYQESVLDNATGHIKCLQLQLKDLISRRLRDESISTPLVLLEGQGHYYYTNEMNFEGPLEEMVESLIKENPSAVFELLESRGLYMIPIDSASELYRAE